MTVKKQNIWMRLVTVVENACKPIFYKLEKWTEEQKEADEMKMKLIEKELELVEAELCLEEAIENMDKELKRVQKEEEKKVEKGLQEEEDILSPEIASQDIKTLAAEEEDEGEEEEEEEDDLTPSSFGSVIEDQDSSKNDQKENKPGRSPFSASSLSLASCSLVSSSSLVSVVSHQLQQLFPMWEKWTLQLKPSPPKPSSLFGKSSTHNWPMLEIESSKPNISPSQGNFQLAFRKPLNPKHVCKIPKKPWRLQITKLQLATCCNRRGFAEHTIFALQFGYWNTMSCSLSLSLCIFCVCCTT